MESIEAEVINNYLRTLPHVPLKDDPFFRLVWSDDTRELRTGTFTEWYGKVLIREYQATERVPKYNWLKERWVLEMWCPPEVAYNDELPESISGSYEPVFVFEDAKHNVLPLNLRVVQILVQRLMQPRRSRLQIRTDILNEMAAKELQAENLDASVLHDDTELTSLLHFGEAIIMPSEYPIESPNLRNKQ
jgi:hypothetical protein